MHLRVQLCQDPRTEFSLLRENQPHPQSARSYNSSSRQNLRCSWAKVPRETLFRIHRGQLGTSHAQPASQSVIVYKNTRNVAGPAHLGSTHCSQAADFWTSFKMQPQPYSSRNNLWWPAWTLPLKQPPPFTLKRSTARRNPQPGCTCKKQPRQRTRSGSKQLKDTTAPLSRIQQCQRLGRAALPHRMMMTTQNSPLLQPGKAVSVHRSSKRSSSGCLTELA